MTKPKSDRLCPICMKSLQLVSKHLKEYHNITNQQERDILNKLATGRVPVPPGPCPLPNCAQHLLNVEKHLMSHKDKTAATLEKERASLKRKASLALLAELRASNPQPPMVSTLDVDEGPSTSSSSSSSSPSPSTSTSSHRCPNPACKRLAKENRRLKDTVAELKRQLLVRGQPQARPQPQPGPQPQPQPGPQPQPQPQPRPWRQPRPQPESASSSEPEGQEVAQQQPRQPGQTAKRRLPFSRDPPAEAPRKRRQKLRHVSSPAAPAAAGTSSEDDGDSPEKKMQPAAKKAFRAIAPYFKGKSRGSKLRDIALGTSLDNYMHEYEEFIFCPEGTSKMKENAISKTSRVKVFLKYLMLGWSTIIYWNWEFLFNVPLLKSYPAVLRKVGLAPTTVILYVGQAIPFMEYFRATPPKHSRVSGGQSKIIIRELRKMSRDLGRTVLGHQSLVKQGKVLKFVPKEDLAKCQALARAKIPSLLEDIKNVPPRDPRTRYRFFGYLAAYLSCIYGHRTGVLTKMRVKEVKAAIGDDETGYLINVMEHKTVRKFGTAQIYLEPEEFGWFRTWLRLRSRAVPTNGYFFSSLGHGEAKDIVRYLRKAWAEMRLKGNPSVLDIRTAVSTYNFETNDAEVRQNLSKFMCHSQETEERFYALHKNLARAKKSHAAAPAAGPAPAAAAAAGHAPAVEGDEACKATPKKRALALSKLARKVKQKVGLSPTSVRRTAIVRLRKL